MSNDSAYEITDLLSTAIHVGRSSYDATLRRRLLNLISYFPAILKEIASLSRGDVFRVVMSPENVHLFKQGANGIYRPLLHNGRQIVENVGLIRVSPEYLRALSNAALMVTMTAIATKLEAIEVGVRNITKLTADIQRGKVKGAIDALALAQSLSNPAERRVQILSACGQIVVELGALTGQLHAHIFQMPTEKTGWFDGIFGNGIDAAKEAYEKVCLDVQILTVGIPTLLRTYHDLDEPGTAQAAIGRIVHGLKHANLPNAIQKARLLPFRTGSPSPEGLLSAFHDEINNMGVPLLRIDPIKGSPVSIDITPEELLD